MRLTERAVNSDLHREGGNSGCADRVLPPGGGRCSLLHVRSFGGGLDLQLGPGQVLQLVAAAAGRWPHLAAAPRSRRLLLLLHNELQLLGGVQGPLSQGPLGDLQAKDVQHHVGAQPAHQGGGARGVVGLPVVEKEAVHLEGRRQGGGG